jgi:hypothetical protein
MCPEARDAGSMNQSPEPSADDASAGARYETTEELAAGVRRHPKTIEAYARKGLLPSYQFLRGGPRQFIPGEVDAALKALRAGPTVVQPRVDERTSRRRQRTPGLDFDVGRIGRDEGQAAS